MLLRLLAHAACGVVTERTRLALPGPTFGYVPESFASFQLARALLATFENFLK